MGRDFRGPPKDYKTMEAATEKKCEFNFLESDGALPNPSMRLSEKTENKVDEIKNITLHQHT